MGNYGSGYGLKALLNDDIHGLITTVRGSYNSYTAATHFTTLTKDSNGTITAYTTDQNSSTVSNYFGIVDYEF